MRLVPSLLGLAGTDCRVAAFCCVVSSPARSLCRSWTMKPSRAIAVELHDRPGRTTAVSSTSIIAERRWPRANFQEVGEI